MIDREMALVSTNAALELVRQRAAASPTYGLYIHFNGQLERILATLEDPSLPAVTQREWLNIGLLAVRELETTDPELANALMDADYDFKHTC